MRFLIAAVLLCFLGIASATQVSTTINYDVRSSTMKFNNATQLTLSATEQNVVFTVAPQSPVVVQFAPPAVGANSWTYSLTSGDATKTTTVAAGQVVKLLISNGDVLYLTSASGVTISISCLAYQSR